jgi:hypothetical protein
MINNTDLHINVQEIDNNIQKKYRTRDCMELILILIALLPIFYYNGCLANYLANKYARNKTIFSDSKIIYNPFKNPNVGEYIIFGYILMVVISSVISLTILLLIMVTCFKKKNLFVIAVLANIGLLFIVTIDTF